MTPDCPTAFDKEHECNYFVFTQEGVFVRAFGVLLGIWAKITGVQFARIKKEYFKCSIIGDGTDPHYYVKDVHPPPVIRSHCQKIPAPEEVKME